MATVEENAFIDDSDEEFSDDGDFSDFDDDENVALPKTKKGSKPTASAKSTTKSTTKSKSLVGAKGSKGLAHRSMNEAADDDDIAKPAAKKNGGVKKEKTIEERYQKKSQHEHILLRPDTYVGSLLPTEEEMFVYDEDEDAIVKKKITFTPGLFKIFDEIIVNAADNKQRDEDMTLLEVVIDAEKNVMSVKNNGKGIPVALHAEHNMYVPTMIFGHLLTGSNFDDEEEKTTGGRNGYGAKLANIFSTEFIVECLDTERGLKFKQVFRENMLKPEEPIVKSASAAEKKKGDYVKITFSPELPRFNMEKLDKDTVGLLSRRAWDIAGTMANSHGRKLVVTLNGKKLPVKSFQDYVKAHQGINNPIAFERVDDMWEVGVAATTEHGIPQHVSFVNAICTYKGGSHVTFVADKIAKSLQKVIEKKNKGGTKISPAQIRNQLCVFVNALVKNPSFDSQTKDYLTNKTKEYTGQCKISDKFLKQAAKGEIVDNILAFARFKQSRELNKTGGTKKLKVKGIPKLDDANKAGSSSSTKCTLILTEGDSAKSLAMSGLSVVGRDHYGVYPLKGKPLNVRDADHKKIVANEEIKSIIEILGLKHGVVYTEENIKTLRYGHLMIMADQDHDGSHIKGLVVNFIHRFWPSLLDVPGFLQCFITPIVKATKGKQTQTFFTLPEYEEWKKSTGNDAKGWKIKYYKGLGTSTSAEAKDYFSNLDLHEVTFERLSLDDKAAEDVLNEDANGMDVDELDFAAGKEAPSKKTKKTTVVPGQINSYGSDLIDMVFNKDRVPDRKNWLNALKKDTYLDYNEAQGQGVKYSDFINKELILFSKADCERSISHVMDGFKPSQRKVLFACIKRRLKDEMKVAQLAGYISEHTAYHHGEMSLHGTMVGMAQSFVGSNNVNLLTPAGQFGTRRLGGKDCASPRYIFTKLEKITRTIFHPDDDELLNYLSDDGASIEPEYFMPVIPLVLVNGADGIGTGWSSKVPNYDPRIIIANLRRKLRGQEVEPMSPSYAGFTGEIIAEDENTTSFEVKGRIERIDDTTLVITELPVKVWTQAYKERLEKMLNETAKGADGPDIKDFVENHTETTVSFTITASKDKIDAWEKAKGGLYKKFALTGSIATSNMNLYDTEGCITKYSSPESIMDAFFTKRLEYYGKRKDRLVEKLHHEQKMLSNKARFVEEVCIGDIVVGNRKKVELLQDLQSRKYDLMDSTSTEEDAEQNEEEDLSTSKLSKGYEYLLGMKIWSLTYEKAQELRTQLAERTKELEDLEATPPSMIWERDLAAIEEALDERDEQIAEAASDEKQARKKTAKRNASKAKEAAATKKKAKSKKALAWDSDDESSDEEMDFDDDLSVEVVKKIATSRRTAAVKKASTKAPVLQAATKPTLEPAPKAAPVKAKESAKPDKEEEDDDGDDDDMDLEKDLMSRLKKQSASAAKATAKTSVLEAGNDDSESASSGSKRASPKTTMDPVVKPAKKAAPMKAAPAKKKTAPKKKVVHGNSEDEFDFASSDDDNSIGIPAPLRETNGLTRRATSKNIGSYAAMLADSDEEVSASAAKATAKTSVLEAGNDDSESASSGSKRASPKTPMDPVVKRAKKAPPMKAAPAKKKTAPKKKVVHDNSEDEFDFASSDDDNSIGISAPLRETNGRTRRATSKNTGSYAAMLADSDEEVECGDDSGDESDF